MHDSFHHLTLFSAKRKDFLYAIALTLCCVALNLLGSKAAVAVGAPLFLDAIGTVVAAVLGGYLPGILTGYLTNLFSSLGGDPINAYYGSLNVLIALCASLFAQHGYFRRWWKALLCVPVFAVIGGGLGSIITWFLYGMGFGEGISAPLAHYFYEHAALSVFYSQFLADLLLDLLDKAVTLAVALLLIRLLPAALREKLGRFGWRHFQKHPESSHHFEHTMSLRVKTLIMLSVAMLVIGVAATVISFSLFRDVTVQDHAKLGQAVSDLAASILDADMVDAYLRAGRGRARLHRRGAPSLRRP